MSGDWVISFKMIEYNIYILQHFQYLNSSFYIIININIYISIIICSLIVN